MEAISGIIFASEKCNIQGLPDLQDIFLVKYGKEFVSSILELRPSSAVHPLVWYGAIY